MKIENVKLKDIKPYERNAKKHDETQIKNVMESIKQFGFAQPVVVDKNNVLIIGHCRTVAAKRLQMEEVPCYRMEELTEEQVDKLRLLDNKLNESDWDLDLLFEDVPKLDFSDFDIDWGIDDLFEDEETEIIEDEFSEEVEPISKEGDLWILGNHRLICGDSTDEKVIERLMDGKKADMVFTDPPYGMKKEKEGVLNDNLNFDDLLDFNRQWIPLTFGALKDNGSWYCWGIDEPLMDIYSNILKPMIKDKRITFRNLITWRKGAFGSGGGTGVGQAIQRSYFPEDEKCLFVMCGTQGFNNNQDNYFEEYEPIRKYLETEAQKAQIDARKLKKICGVGMFSHWFTKSQWDLMKEEHYKKIQQYCVDNSINAFGVEFGKIKKQYDEIKKQYDEIKKQWYDTRAYFDNTHDMMTNVWDFGRVQGNERKECGSHATPKPIALCSRAIKSSSREGEIVLDVFGGSGSTLIASEQFNRSCCMCELDPHYVDVIVNRYINFTNSNENVYLIRDGEKIPFSEIDNIKE